MKTKNLLLLLVLVTAIIAAIVAILEIGDPDVQTEAALPGIQGPGSATK